VLSVTIAVGLGLLEVQNQQLAQHAQEWGRLELNKVFLQWKEVAQHAQEWDK
jgi:hypothetical protein